MKKLICSLLTVLLLVSSFSVVATDTPRRGTKDNPFYASKEESGNVLNFEGIDLNSSKIITADITIKVLGEYTVTPAYAMIEKFGRESYIRGPGYSCFKVLVSVSSLEGGSTVHIRAEDDFKVVDNNGVIAPVLTAFSRADILDDTSAYLYIGCRTVGSMPVYIVFDNTLWIDVINAPYIENEPVLGVQ